MKSDLGLGHSGIVREPAVHADCLVVLLHGLGSKASFMLPLVNAIASELPTVAAVALDGIEPFDKAPVGRQWFSTKGITRDNRCERIEACLPSVCAVIGHLQKRFNVPPERTALVGFSQGAMIAFQIAATRDPPAAVVALAGRLSTAVTIFGTRRPPMLISLGDKDAVISLEEGAHAARTFSDAGYPVEMQVIAGHGHSISDPQLAKCVAFLKACFSSHPG